MYYFYMDTNAEEQIISAFIKLKEMFPDLDDEVIWDIFMSVNCDFNATLNIMLSFNDNDTNQKSGENKKNDKKNNMSGFEIGDNPDDMKKMPTNSNISGFNIMEKFGKLFKNKYKKEKEDGHDYQRLGFTLGVLKSFPFVPKLTSPAAAKSSVPCLSGNPPKSVICEGSPAGILNPYA